MKQPTATPNSRSRVAARGAGSRGPGLTHREPGRRWYADRPGKRPAARGEKPVDSGDRAGYDRCSPLSAHVRSILEVLMQPIRSRPALLAALLAGGLVSAAAAQGPAKPAAPKKPAFDPVLAGDKLHGPKGFKVDLIYNVPRDTQGSWVNLAVDPKGRLITSDQYGKLYRVTPPPPRRCGRRGDQGRADRRRPRRGPGAPLGVRQPVRRRQQGVEVRQRALPRHRHQRRRRPRQGRAAPQARRRRRARPARRGPGPGRQVALRRRRQRHRPPQAGRVDGPADVGRGQPPAADARRPRVHARREGPRRLHLPRQPRRQGLDPAVDGLPERLRHRLQPRGRPVHVRLRHGVGHERPLVPADPRLQLGDRGRLRLPQRRRQVAGLLL